MDADTTQLTDQTAGGEPTDVEEIEDTGRRRGVIVHVLIVLASVLMFLTAVDVWVDRAMLDTDTWVDTADQLLAEPAVREALAVYIVDQLYATVDVATQLDGLLPENLGGLSAALAAALRDPATEAVDRLLSSERTAQVWSQANRAAHRTIVAILKDETNPAFSTTDGAVTLNLREVVVQLGEQLGLPGTVIDRVPEDAGQIALVESETLRQVQRVVSIVEWASWVMFAVVVVLYAAAVFLAEGWRRVATRTVGFSIVVVGLLLVAGLRLGGDWLLDTIVKNELNRPAAAAVWTVGSALLRDLGRDIVAIGLVIVLGALLAGPSRAALAVRRFVAPVFLGSAGLRWVLAATVLLVLVIWAPIPALTTWIGILVVAVVIAASVEGMRRLCRTDQAELTP